MNCKGTIGLQRHTRTAAWMGGLMHPYKELLHSSVGFLSAQLSGLSLPFSVCGGQNLTLVGTKKKKKILFSKIGILEDWPV